MEIPTKTKTAAVKPMAVAVKYLSSSPHLWELQSRFSGEWAQDFLWLQWLPGDEGVKMSGLFLGGLYFQPKSDHKSKLASVLPCIQHCHCYAIIFIPLF